MGCTMGIASHPSTWPWYFTFQMVWVPATMNYGSQLAKKDSLWLHIYCGFWSQQIVCDQGLQIGSLWHINIAKVATQFCSSRLLRPACVPGSQMHLCKIQRVSFMASTHACSDCGVNTDCGWNMDCRVNTGCGYMHRRLMNYVLWTSVLLT